MIIFTPRFLFTPKILAGFAVLALAGHAQAQDAEMDLGDVAPGSVRPLKLTAKNANCEAPQDFRVKLSNEAWYRMSGPTVMSGIPAGGSQSSELLLDFANLSPGRYKGSLAINCESCGWWIFTSCTANDQTIDIKFRIPKPSARNPGRYDSFADAMNDVANGNLNVPLGPPQWIEWDDDNNGFVLPELPGPNVIPRNPGQADFPVPVRDPRNQNPVLPPVNGGVIWVPPVIPHAGEPEKWPYPPSPIGGEARYPREAEFGGFGWDEWEPRIGLRYTQDDVNRPGVPGDKNGDGIADEPRIRIGARYTQDDLDKPPPTPPDRYVPQPDPETNPDRNGDGKVDGIDAAIIFMEAYAKAIYGVPIEYLLPNGPKLLPPPLPKSPARFVEGDLNGDGKFDNSDIIKGLQGGQFGNPVPLPLPDPQGSDDKSSKDSKAEQDAHLKKLLESFGPPKILPTPEDKGSSAADDQKDMELYEAFQRMVHDYYLEELIKELDKGFGGPLVPLELPKTSGDKPKPKAVVLHPPRDFENDMRGQDLKKLRDKRLECIKKTAAVAAAQSEHTEKAKKADDCAKKLAALKAALDKAKAEQVAAEKAAKDAAEHAANYQADLDAAQRASRMAYQTLQMQAAAHISLVREKDAGSPRPAAEAHAKGQVDKATTAADAASRAVSAVKNSKKARDAAARNTAKAAKAAAKKTRDAQKAYDKQKALCKPLIAAASAAKNKISATETALKKCKTELKSAEAAAPGQALSNLQDKLNKAKGRKAGCQRDMDKYARELGKAFKALRLLGVIRPPKEELKTERILNDSQEFYGTLFATGAAKATNVATFEVFAALDALKAGYGIYKIKNSSLTPLSSRFVRSESVKWLTETKGIADNPTEAESIIKVMEGIISRNGTTKHIREEWQRLERQCKANDDDIKRLQERIGKTGR